MAKISRRTISAWFAGSMLAAAATVGATAPVSAGAPLFTISVELFGSCDVYGTAPASSSLTIRIKNSEGVRKEVRYTSSDGSGDWSLPCLNDYIVPGDTVRMTDGTHTRTVTVPGITVKVDRGTDIVSGLAPVGSSIAVQLNRCPSYSGCTSTPERNRTANSQGKYKADYSGSENIKGNDYARVIVMTTSGDSFINYGDAPRISVGLGETTFTGRGTPRSIVKVVLTTSTGTIRATGAAVAGIDYGYLDGDFGSSRGEPVSVRAGDRVDPDFSGGTPFAVPAITLNTDTSTEHASGTCLANRPFEVYAYDPTAPYRPQDYAYVDGVTNGAGHYDADLSTFSSFDLQAGDVVAVYCRTTGGDEVRRRSIA